MTSSLSIQTRLNMNECMYEENEERKLNKQDG